MALTTHFSPLNLTSGKAISKSEQIHCWKKEKKSKLQQGTKCFRWQKFKLTLLVLIKERSDFGREHEQDLIIC